MPTRQLILGTQSARRKEILEYFDIPFKQAISTFNEESIPFKRGDPAAHACTLARYKGQALQGIYSESAILTADTIVVHKDKVYGKPKHRKEAQCFLEELSGEWHTVITGLCLHEGGQSFQRAEATKVLFHPLTPSQISSYLDHLDWADKAGGYAIQRGGGLVVDRIEGCYYNVMGLPLGPLRECLARIGIDLWKHIR